MKQLCLLACAAVVFSFGESTCEAAVEGNQYRGTISNSAGSRILTIEFFSTGNCTAQVSDSSNVFRGPFAESPPFIIVFWSAEFDGEGTANGIEILGLFTTVTFTESGGSSETGILFKQ